MRAYADFCDDVAIHLPKCPRLIIIDAIKHAVTRFCDESQIWVYDCPEIAVSEDSGNVYFMDLPSNTAICYVHTLFGRSNLSAHHGRNQYSDRRDPYLYHIDHPNCLVIDECKIEPVSLKPVLSLKPTFDSLDCADILYDIYQTAIVSGAVAHLQLQPVTNWSAPNMAQAHMAQFEAAILTAKESLNKSLGLSTPNYRTRASFI